MPSVEDGALFDAELTSIPAYVNHAPLSYEEAIGRRSNPEMRDDQAGPATNRAHAEAELEALRAKLAQSSTDYQVNRIRVRSSVRVLNGKWVELKLQIRLDEGMPWLNVLADDHPLLMARVQTRPGDKDGVENTDYVVRAMERFLLIDNGLTWHLGKWEARHGQGTNEYRAWVELRSRHGVAVRTRDDGMLNVYGL